ncbi:Protein SPT2-like protein [Aphelenchoides besseyi]|nr:Protein SPT2-like protein [Aphelenchoides besseyi]
MDFQELLAQASHNAKTSKKLVKESERESEMRKQQDRHRYQMELERGREERKRRAPPKEEKKFVIPKKKPVESEAEVDPNGIQSFLRKQRQAEVEKEIEKKKERERLISLRLQANQGRANKKIASAFGKSAIELQQRYAHNSHVEMELIKRQQREEEEIDRKGKQIRESINRAMESRAGKLAHSSTKASGGGVRVGNVKAGGFAALSAQHESVITQRKTGDELRTASSSRMSEKQRKMAATTKRTTSGNSALDFKALMETAKQNSDPDSVAARTNAMLKANQPSTIADSREVMKRTVDSTRRVQPVVKQPSLSASKTPQQRSTSNLKSLSNPYELSDRRTLGPPSSAKSSSTKTSTVSSNAKGSRPITTSSQSSSTNQSNASMFAPKPEQRYLPGDMRYKPPPEPVSNPSTNGSSAAKPKQMITFADRFRKIAGSSLNSASNANREIPASSNASTRHPVNSSTSQQKLSKIAPPMRKSDSTSMSRYNDRGYRNSPLQSSAVYRSSAMDRDRHSRNSYADRYAERYNDESRFKKSKRPTEDRGRPLSHPGMFKKGRSHMSTSFISGGMYSDEEEEEDSRYGDYDDEHDSEMDDFIDDTEVDDLQRADFEESLRLINPHYNKKKWHERERMIDERQMHARFRDVEAEEKRSARLALYEDIMEAKRGSTGII